MDNSRLTLEQTGSGSSSRRIPCNWFGWKFPQSAIRIREITRPNTTLDLRCCNTRCMGLVSVDQRCFASNKLMWAGSGVYDPGMLVPGIDCECQAPVCDKCIKELRPAHCNICQKQNASLRLFPKETMMSNKNWGLIYRTPHIVFFMKCHENANSFIRANFPDREDYADFSNWFFLKKHQRIDITKMLQPETLDMINRYRLDKAKYSFLLRAFPVTNSFSAEILREPSKLRFKRFFMTSKTVCRFLAIDSFSENRCESVFPFLGLTKKIVERLTCAFWFFNGNQTQDLSWFFVRLIARYFQKLNEIIDDCVCPTYEI